MKYLNIKYKLFESEINNIIEKCKKYDIKNYEIDDDGLLTVYGDVDLRNKLEKEIPIKFKEVYGHFDVSCNSLTSLFGSPEIVHKIYNISSSHVKNLKYAPIEVEHFYCENNKQLYNIINLPKYIYGDISFLYCSNLKSLHGCLKFLNGSVNLNVCYNLNSLKFGPDKVMGSYTCALCKFKTLYGAPKYVGNSFDCAFNELTSLKYSPNYIGADFIFSYNNVTTFKYFPEFIGGNVFLQGNPVHNVWGLFYDKKQIDYFNLLNIISVDGKKINIKKLNIFLKTVNRDPVESVNGYENI